MTIMRTTTRPVVVPPDLARRVRLQERNGGRRYRPEKMTERLVERIDHPARHDVVVSGVVVTSKGRDHATQTVGQRYTSEPSGFSDLPLQSLPEEIRALLVGPEALALPLGEVPA